MELSREELINVWYDIDSGEKKFSKNFLKNFMNVCFAQHDNTLRAAAVDLSRQFPDEDTLKKIIKLKDSEDYDDECLDIFIIDELGERRRSVNTEHFLCFFSTKKSIFVKRFAAKILFFSDIRCEPMHRGVLTNILNESTEKYTKLYLLGYLYDNYQDGALLTQMHKLKKSRDVMFVKELKKILFEFGYT